MAKLPKDDREKIERIVFEELLDFNSIAESGKIEKMHGYEDYYKIKIWFIPCRFKVERRRNSFANRDAAQRNLQVFSLNLDRFGKICLQSKYDFPSKQPRP